MDGLPLIGPGIDYREVPPINQKRLVVFINHFISTTIVFLNKFSQSCEERLQKFDQHLQKLEVSLSILEAKLNSVSGLDDDIKTESIVNSTEATEIQVEATPVVKSEPTPVGQTTEAHDEKIEEKSENVESGMKMSQVPEFARFFRMVQVGVPLPAVKLKMKAEGFDPSILDNPDAPAPPNIAVTETTTQHSDTDSD